MLMTISFDEEVPLQRPGLVNRIAFLITYKFVCFLADWDGDALKAMLMAFGPRHGCMNV